MSDGIEITGMNVVFSALDDWLTEKTQQTDEAVQGAGIATEAGAKQRAPVDTGRFRSGYQYTNLGSCQCQVGNSVEYGPALEFGHATRSGSHVAARPSLFPAFADATSRLQDELNTIYS